MAKTTRKKYPNSFRIKVAKEAAGGSVVAVAKKYKLSDNNVYNWRAILKSSGEAGFVGAGKRAPLSNKVGKVAPVGNNPGQIKKRLGVAISGVVADIITGLRSQLATETKRRVSAERSVEKARKQLHRAMVSLKG